MIGRFGNGDAGSGNFVLTPIQNALKFSGSAPKKTQRRELGSQKQKDCCSFEKSAIPHAIKVATNSTSDSAARPLKSHRRKRFIGGDCIALRSIGFGKSSISQTVPDRRCSTCSDFVRRLNCSALRASVRSGTENVATNAVGMKWRVPVRLGLPASKSPCRRSSRHVFSCGIPRCIRVDSPSYKHRWHCRPIRRREVVDIPNC